MAGKQQYAIQSLYHRSIPVFARLGRICRIFLPSVGNPSTFRIFHQGGVVNSELTAVAVKINGLWIPVHNVNTGRVGEYRVPHGYPGTRIEKIMTSDQMSKLISNVAKSALKNLDKYAITLKEWVAENPERHLDHLEGVLNGACWGLNDPKAYLDGDKWEYVLDQIGLRYSHDWRRRSWTLLQ